jgi:hypothetical protein
LGERGHHVQEQRLAERTGLLGAVEHCDPAYARRQGGQQRRHRERPVQPHLQDTDLLAVRPQMGHGLLGGLRAGTHQHQDPLRVGVPDVVDDAVPSPGPGVQFPHHLGHRVGHQRVERIDRLAPLEVHVRVLRGAADERPLRRQRPAAVRPHQVHRHQGAQVVIGQQLDGVELVRGAETVEEVHERDPRP